MSKNKQSAPVFKAARKAVFDLLSQGTLEACKEAVALCQKAEKTDPKELFLSIAVHAIKYVGKGGNAHAVLPNGTAVYIDPINESPETINKLLERVYSTTLERLKYASE